MLHEEENFKDICNILDLNRATLYRRMNKECADRKRAKDKEDFLNRKLLFDIVNLKKAHPFWGYRRVWAFLKFKKRYDNINKKRIYRIMRDNNLLNTKEKKLKAERKFKSRPKAEKPREFLGIDATKFWINGIGWVNLIVLIDWYTKEILSYTLSVRNRSEEWKEALLKGLNNGSFRQGIGLKKINLISDHGSQPTSHGFMRFCKDYGINQIFATFNNPKGNTDTERVMRTIKEEVVWINEFETIDEAEEEIKDFIDFYNNEYCHSSIGCKSPAEYFNEWVRLNGGKIA